MHMGGNVICVGDDLISAWTFGPRRPNVTVISTDSDLMFMEIKELIRFQPKGTRFFSYPTKKIMRHVDMKTEQEWVAAAILSLNDYDASVGSTSFKAVIEGIKEIHRSWSHRRGVDRLLKDTSKNFAGLKGATTTLCRQRKIQPSKEATVHVTRSSISSSQIPPPTTNENDVVQMPTLHQSQSGSTSTLDSSLPATPSMPLPDAVMGNASASNDRIAAVDINKNHRSHGFQKHTTSHKYRPRGFTSAFTSQHKNTEPKGVKDQTIGRLGPATQVLADEDEDDDDHDTFPDYEDILDDVAVENLLAPPIVLTEVNLTPETTAAD
ncbi:hypothetical protein BGZ83_008232 [Gryganskiella cystojenkinii]|nr:hypothetical protein BGZ83_008232 [Gryganskiella cystojenkinii]